MSECEIKMEIRHIVNGYEHISTKACKSIAKAIKLRHRDLDRTYVEMLTKNIIQENN